MKQYAYLTMIIHPFLRYSKEEFILEILLILCAIIIDNSNNYT